MKKFVGIFLLLLASLAVVVGVFFFIKGKRGQGASGALKITTSHTATVFLNDEEKGSTPFDQELAPGEYQVRLIPQESVSSWEGKVTVSSNVLTFVNRELGATDITSGGEILTLEKIQGNKSQVSVITNPDGSIVTFDNQEKGMAPILIESIDPGAYEMSVALTGYAPRAIKIKTTLGYKLNAMIDLSSTTDINPTPSPEITPSPTPEPSSKSSPKATVKPSPSSSTKPSSSTTVKSSPPPKPYIEVLSTPTDFLNVRKDPTTSADNILTKIYPGEFYKFIDEQGDWLQIEYEKDKKGWISAQYARKHE